MRAIAARIVLVVALNCCGLLAALGASPVPQAPVLESRAYLMQDFDSGRVLVESNVDVRVSPASLTKLMTVYAVLAELEEGHVKLDDMVRVSRRARRTPGSRMFLEVDSLVSIRDLLMGIIVQSGNDASVAIAEHVAGDEGAFSNLMNQHAKRLGMTGSNFVNSSGLPHGDHYTTARDMAIMARALIADFPDQYDWHAVREFTHNNIRQPNRNKLLGRDSRVDGLKTGYTKSAGYCIVVSGKQKGMRLIVVIMGAESVSARERQAQALLNYGFRFYETHQVYGAREPVTEVKVWKGALDTLKVGLGLDLYVTVPRGTYKDLEADLAVDRQTLAPVRAGEPKGELRISLGEELVARRELLALHGVTEGNIWRRVSDHVKLLFE